MAFQLHNRQRVIPSDRRDKHSEAIMSQEYALLRSYEVPKSHEHANDRYLPQWTNSVC